MKTKNIAGRIVGTPEHIDASCGMSIRLNDEDLSRVIEEVKSLKVTDIRAFSVNKDASNVEKMYSEIKLFD